MKKCCASVIRDSERPQTRTASMTGVSMGRVRLTDCTTGTGPSLERLVSNKKDTAVGN